MGTEARGSRLFYAGLLILQCILWGIANPLIKLGTQIITPFYLMSVRFVLAVCCFLLVFLWRAARWRYREQAGDFSWEAFSPQSTGQGPHNRVTKNRYDSGINRKTLPKLLISGVLTGSAYILSNLALFLTEATVAGFLMSLAVLVTPFLSRIMLKTRVSPWYIAIIAAVVTGLYMLCSGGGGLSFGVGELCALGASLLFGISLTYVSKYGPVLKLDPFVLSLFQVGFSAALSVSCALLFEDWHILQAIDTNIALLILYLVIGATCITYLLQNVALAHISAVFVSVAFCSESVFTALFSFFILGERLSAVGLAGACIITAGVAAASVLNAKNG